MAIVIEDLQMEQLAQRIAKAEGVSVTEVMRESLQSLAGIRGLATQKSPLRERLAKLAHEVDALPRRASVNNLSDNDILGYNEHGTKLQRFLEEIDALVMPLTNGRLRSLILPLSDMARGKATLHNLISGIVQSMH